MVAAPRAGAPPRPRPRARAQPARHAAAGARHAARRSPSFELDKDGDTVVWRRGLTGSTAWPRRRPRVRVRRRRHARAPRPRRPRPPAAGRGRGARADPRLGRPLVLFTNGSHVPLARRSPRGLREDGLPVADDEMLTPVESAITYLRRRHRDRPGAAVRLRRRSASGWRRPGSPWPTARRPRSCSSPTSTRSTCRAGARRARGQARRAAAHRQLRARLRGRQRDHLQPRRDGHRRDRQGRPARGRGSSASRRAPRSRRSCAGSACRPSEIAVIGDDLGMDIALGRMGGSRTVLVRSGISGATTSTSCPSAGAPTRSSTASRTCWKCSPEPYAGGSTHGHDRAAAPAASSSRPG